MSKRRKKNRQAKQAVVTADKGWKIVQRGPGGPGLDAQPSLYDAACALAVAGNHEEACAQFSKLLAGPMGWPQQALIFNDLAALDAIAGNLEWAKEGFAAALEVDQQCEPARRNLALIIDDLESPQPHSAAAPPPPSAPTGAIKVAILSFLFNWPSTGGGIVHTVELAQFLIKAGYQVQHFFACFVPWGIGGVEQPVSFPSHALEFSDSDWHVSAIQERFHQAVHAFDPDYVIVTDSWNFKPLLAEAVRDYPYILRFQAMECLCPLNNVRLLMESKGRVRQCPLHQLANPQDCARCIQERGRFSGSLHQAERALSGVGTPEYHERLMRVVRNATAVLVVNPLHEAMFRPYSQCVRVATAGMDPDRFPTPAEPHLSATGKVGLLFAGLVEEAIKGFDVLHEACALLWQRRQDFELVATGDPPGSFDAFTRFVGWQSQESLPHHLRETDILVMPTIAQEALGRTAVEAMAAGRPVIASRLGGLPFTVVDGVTGLLFEPGNAADLARKIERLLDDAELRVQLGQAGRRRFEEHYSWDVIIDRHYKPLLNRRRSPKPSVNGYRPQIPDRVDHGQLVQTVSKYFRQPAADVENMLNTYRRLHEAKGYARTLGERKTLCFEEAFVLAVLLGALRPPTIVEIGVLNGRSLRRLIDIKTLLGLDSRVIGFDVVQEVPLFTPEEAELVVKDLTGSFAREVLQTYPPGLLFLDIHVYALLKEAIEQVIKDAGKWTLAIHDCGRGLCNPHMSLAKDDPRVTSSTGVWERHILAEVFGVADPLSEELDSLETDTHRLEVFPTPHGLALVMPK